MQFMIVDAPSGPTLPNFVAALTENNNLMATSANGMSYVNEGAVDTDFNGYYVVCTDPDLWLLSGRLSGAVKVYKAADGKTWVPVATGLVGFYAYGACVKFGSLYCLGSVNGGAGPLFRYSSDLAAWSSPVTVNAGFGTSGQNAIFDAATDGTTLVLVGNNVNGNCLITYSTDAANFTAATLPTNHTGTRRGVAYGGGVWVAVGSGAAGAAAIWTSTDSGHTWVEQVAPVGFSTAIAACVRYSTTLAQFVVMDSSGHIATSIDGGVTWVERTSPFTLCNRAVWSERVELWVMAGEIENGDEGSNRVATSPTGENWTLQPADWVGEYVYVGAVGALLP